MTASWFAAVPGGCPLAADVSQTNWNNWGVKITLASFRKAPVRLPVLASNLPPLRSGIASVPKNLILNPPTLGSAWQALLLTAKTFMA